MKKAISQITTRRTLMVAFVALVIAASIGVLLDYPHQHVLARAEQYRSIASISQLKTEQIERWRRDRVAQGETAAANPLIARDLPAVQAVQGRAGMFEGRDYRGERVLADLRPGERASGKEHREVP